MATLENTEIQRIIKTNPNGTFIKFLQAKYEVMRAHVTGIHAENLINKIEGFERDNIVKARKKMMLSNKDLMYRVLKPRDKIFTAKGGIESYNLSTTELIQDWKKFLSRCAGKKTSLKEFIKQSLVRGFDIDPMGLKWVGINDEGEPYPTYKCITCIYDYEVNNEGTPEYVVFKCTPKEIANYIEAGLITGIDKSRTNPKVFRVVDDSRDMIWIWANQEPQILAEMPNIFEQVQGEVISDIVEEDEHGMRYWESDLYPTTELLSQFVFSRSIYNIAYSQTAYPIMWMQAAPCPTCHGKKKLGIPMNGDVPRAGQGDMNCPECGGSGIYPHIQNSDTYIWEFQKDDKNRVPAPPLGVIEGSVESLQYMKNEKIDIETLITETLWGVSKVFPNAKVEDSKSSIGRGNTSETAFESKLNEQPKYDKLKEFSKWLGNSIKWYADIMGKIKYGDAYISSSVLCGDRYAIESPDEILTRIDKAKVGGAAQAVLESLHMEYLETKYENNPLELRKHKIYYVGEPFFFYSVADILLWPQIPIIQLLEKQMWGEFMCTLTDKEIAAIPDDNIPATIQEMIRKYIMKKYVADKQVDALLFAGDGQLLNIGDNARVKLNLAKKPEDLGKSFKVTNIAGDNISLDGVKNTYTRAELERVF